MTQLETGRMLYAQVATAYQAIESTTSREQVRATLVALLRAAPPEVLPRLIYLTQGKLYPDFEGIEIGLAERLALRAVAAVVGRPEHEVAADLASSGDLGTTAEHLLATYLGPDAHREPSLTVVDVYVGLDTIAWTTGPGTIGRKLGVLEDLLRRVTPIEARYLVRTVTGKLRLGVEDSTPLDALARAFAGPGARPAIERAYNLSSDLGAVAGTLVQGGLSALEAFAPEPNRPNRPIRPMKAERLKSAEEVLERLGGSCAAELKYDGERRQIHKRGAEVRIFSRRLNPISHQYPDGAEMTRTHVRAETAILEAEAVVHDPSSGELLPFQELLRRKRKHGVDQAAVERPVMLVGFELLYVDGEDLTQLPYPARRARLESVWEADTRFQLAPRRLVRNVPELEEYLELAVSEGAEGLVCKSIAPDSIYEAGARSWLWIKLKRDSRLALIDTLDLVAVVAFSGRGQRAGTYGSLLLAAYDRHVDVFRTVAGCGSGFDDAELRDLPGRFASHVIPHRHARVDARLAADVWFSPAVVLEVAGAELTLSPVHTAAAGCFRAASGLALRYPRFIGRWRHDKSPEDATSVEELIEIYQRSNRGLQAHP